MLSVSDLQVSYGAISALSGISFQVKPGAIVTLIGGNGAGKTTTLRTISGLLRAKTGKVTFAGEDVSALPAHKIVARGLCHVPEGRMIFSNLTVDENLAMGAYLQNDAVINARPIASICCSPPERVPAVCLSRSLSRGKMLNTYSRFRALMTASFCR